MCMEPWSMYLRRNMKSSSKIFIPWCLETTQAILTSFPLVREAFQ